MRKISYDNYRLTTITRVSIGSKSTLQKSDFEIENKKLLINGDKGQIEIDDIIFDNKGILDTIIDFKIENTYNKLDDPLLDDYYVYTGVKDQKKKKEFKKILVKASQVDDFKRELSNKQFTLDNSANPVKLKNLSNDKTSFMYFDNVLRNPISALPCNGVNYYVPGSSLKGSILSNYTEDIKKQFSNINFKDIPVELEQLLISSPCTIANNKMKEKNDNTESNDNPSKIKKNINQSNNIMFINKNTSLDIKLDNRIEKLITQPTIKGNNINEQTIKKLNNAIEYIQSYLIENCKLYEQHLNKKLEDKTKLDKLTEFREEALESELKKVIGNLNRYIQIIKKDKDSLYFFMGNNKKLILAANNMDEVKNSGLSFDTDYEIYGLVKLERV